MTPAEVTVYSDGRERARVDEAMQSARNAALVAMAFGAGSSEMAPEDRMASLEEVLVPQSGNVRREAQKSARAARSGFSLMADRVRKALGVKDDD